MSLAQFTLIAELLQAKPEDLLFPPTDVLKARQYRRIAEGIAELDEGQLAAIATIIDGMRKKTS